MVRTRETAISLGMAIGLMLLLTAFAIQAVLPGPVVAATDRLPNLRMLSLRDWHIQDAGGRRLLRFTTIMANEGPGAFEVRGLRPDTDTEQMRIWQVIYDGSGDRRRVRTGAIGRYSGDGHDHWHVQRIMTYELYKVDNPATVRGGAKTGFCFLDTTAWRLGLPHARQHPYYQESWCGTRKTLSTRVGISVGWGDRYPWDFAYQWIDITGLQPGRYVVRSTVDIANWYRETDNYDNCRWARIRIPSSGTRVKVLESGGGCGRAAITPAKTFPGAVEWDPMRRIVMQPGTYTGYTFNALGTELRTRTHTKGRGSGADTVRRARVPGREGRWFYVKSGTWDGYWLRDTSRVDLEPEE